MFDRIKSFIDSSMGFYTLFIIMMIFVYMFGILASTNLVAFIMLICAMIMLIGLLVRWLWIC